MDRQLHGDRLIKLWELSEQFGQQDLGLVVRFGRKTRGVLDRGLKVQFGKNPLGIGGNAILGEPGGGVKMGGLKDRGRICHLQVKVSREENDIRIVTI